MTFSFAGVSFGTVVAGLLNYRLPIYEGALRWIALDNSMGRLCLSGVLKVARPDLRLVSGGTTQEFSRTVPIPMVGVSGQINITKSFKTYGSIKVLDLSLASLKTSVSDWDLGAIYDWHDALWGKGLRFAGGYRKLSFELTSDAGTSNEAGFDIRHQGPFVEIGTSF